MVAVSVTAMSACDRLAVGGERRGPERFSFAMVAGAGNTREAETRLVSLGLDIEPQAGSVIHRATVGSGTGRVDFYSWREADSTGLIVSCAGRFRDDDGGWTCGPDRVVVGMEPVGESFDADGWRSTTLVTGPRVVEILGTTDDGTEYTLRPVAGLAFVEWRAARGALRLTALDEAGAVVDEVVLAPQLS